MRRKPRKFLALTAPIRRVCFVTGTRAEFGLMHSTLAAIRDHPNLQLQIIATGMHLDPSRGQSIDAIRAAGWRVDRVVPWDPSFSTTSNGTARATGAALGGTAEALDALRSDIVLVVGDRVEAFAAAAAGHVAGRVVAHVHGGDRAAGQVDDALRHAITKLAHVHFPATAASAARLLRLGEDRWRIQRVGSPGIDGIVQAAAPRTEVERAVGPLPPRKYAVLVLHPEDADETIEHRRAASLAAAVARAGFPQTVIVHPNNDPGAGGIVRAWESVKNDDRFVVRADLPRPVFLGLLRDAAVLVGNSSSGIIEAASFRLPVIDVGPRQHGRERGGNVVNVPYHGARLFRALSQAWNNGRPLPARGSNLYGGISAGRRIAATLAAMRLNDRLLRKLIAY